MVMQYWEPKPGLEPTLPLDCGIFQLTDMGARHWMVMDGWTFDEAAILLVGANPKHIREFEKDPNISQPDYTSCGYVGIRDRLQRAADMGVLTFPCPPHSVVKWAADKHAIPAPLEELLRVHVSGQAGALTIKPAPVTTPEPQAGPVVPESASVWTLRKPQRIQGYALPLYNILKAAHLAGRTCPTAHDVLEAWRDKAPSEVAKVMSASFDYYDANGNTKEADLDAIRKAIDRMTCQLAR